MDDYRYILNEAAKSSDTTAILKEIYPMVETKMKANTSKYKQCVSRFINNRIGVLYANAPMEKMYFGESDIDDFFKSTGIDKSKVIEGIKHTYYYPEPNFNPRYAKDEFVIAMICVIRYFKLKKMSKELDLAMVHLACSGKFYTSIFHASFPVTDPQPHIMDYVVTNIATNKYDIVREGNVIGAVRSICNTWIDTYDDRFKKFTDEDVVYVIQQLHNRIVSFIRNIAELYYDAFENRDLYITYDADDVSEDDYHLADSDSLKMDRAVSAAMNAINGKGVDQLTCKRAADSSKGLIKTDELKTILETLLAKPDDIVLVRELITGMVSTYFQQSKTKDVRDLSFVTYSCTPKPNSKDPIIIRQREILIILLLNNSEKFARRRSRLQTEQAYFRCMLMYFALITQKANK